MTVAVTEFTTPDLIARRAELLASIAFTHDELRERVECDAATEAEYSALESLDEIAFLLGEDDE